MQGAAGSVGGVEASELGKRWGLRGAVEIMIRLWDMMTAANRCRESTKVIYSKLDVE